MFKFADKTASKKPRSHSQMKTTEQCYSAVPFIILCNAVLTFESVDEILKCDHSNESY